jgi:hypothetical protein
MECARAVAVASDGNRPWTKDASEAGRKSQRGGGVVGGLQQERERLGGNFFAIFMMQTWSE